MGLFLLSVIKILAAFGLLPIVISALIALHKHVISQYPGHEDWFFIWGEEAFLIAFLFIHQFEAFYAFGLKIMQKLFGFLTPLDKFIPYILPAYLTLMTLIFYAVKQIWFKSDAYDHYVIFFAGFFFALHIVVTAKDLQECEKSIIKPDYLLTMCFAIIVSTCVTILLLDLVLHKMTFVDFFESAIIRAKEMYVWCFDKVYQR